MEKFADVEFPHSPDGPLKVLLTRKNYCTEEGFGTAPSVYPVTIVKSRYQGTYEGAAWICFPVHPELLAEGQWRDWQGSDIECAEWWARAQREQWPIGLGSSPDLAYDNLIARAGSKAGINLADWVAEPTWDKTEIARRNDGLRGERFEHRRERGQWPQLGTDEAGKSLAVCRLAPPRAAG